MSRRRQRAAERHIKNYDGGVGHDEAVRQLPCVACAHVGRKQATRTEAAHVVPRSRGGGADVLVPLCHDDHMLLDWRPWQFREKYPDLDLMKIATELAKENEVSKKESKVELMRQQREAPREVKEPLSAVEMSLLGQYERTIGQGIAAIDRGMEDVGGALGNIREKRLYRARFSSFEAYVEERWGIGKRYANRLIAGTRVRALLSAGGAEVLPENEAQARPLTRLPEEERSEAWAEVVETAEGNVTAARVTEVVEGRLNGDSKEEKLRAWKEKYKQEKEEAKAQGLCPKCRQPLPKDAA